MSPRSLFFLPLFLAMALGSCSPSSGGGCQSPQWTSGGDKMLGMEAPNFTLPNLKGERVELKSWTAQKPVLLVFWATWCPSCKEEIPVLNEWSAKYPGLQILGINVEESPDRVRSFVEKQKVRYPVLLDGNSEVTNQYGLVGIPAAILVAKGGKVIYYGFGLPENIDRLIKE